MAPLHHHFELIGWSEPKVITRFVIVAIIFALFSLDDVEAAVMTDERIRMFDVEGKRVTVAGAARSGIAAAELLARRGARVTLSDTRAEVAGGRARCARWACSSSSAGTRPQTFTGADLVVLSPGVPPEQPAVAGRARRAACRSSARSSSRRAGCRAA